MRLALALVLALALPACATAAQGGGDDWYPNSPTGKKEYDRRGGYAEVGLVQGFENFDTSGTGVKAGDSDPGFALRGGWRFDKEVAVEGTVENVTNFTLKSGSASADVDFWTFGVQGKYYFAQQKIQPYALVGFGVARGESSAPGVSSDNGGYIRIGGGADYYLNKDVALFGELDYDRLTGNLKDFDRVDLIFGVLVRF